MKHKVNFWLLFAALLSTFALTSCSDPDEDEEDDIYVNIIGGGNSDTEDGDGCDCTPNYTDPAALIGTWEYNSYKYVVDPVEDYAYRCQELLTFNSDGKTFTYQLIIYMTDGTTKMDDVVRGEYVYDGIGEMITFTYTYEDGDTSKGSASVYIRGDVLHWGVGVYARVE